MKQLIGIIRSVTAVTAVVLLASVHQSGFAQTPISITGCREITSGGSYILTQDVALSSSDVCLDIKAANVTIDGNSRSITYTNGTPGIAVNSSTESADYSNMVVHHLTSNGSVQVYGDHTNNVTLHHVNLGSVSILSSNDVAVQDSTLKSLSATPLGLGMPVERLTLQRNTFVASDVEKMVFLLGGTWVENPTTYTCVRGDFLIEDNTFTSYWPENTSTDEPLILTIRCATHSIVRRNTLKGTGGAVGIYLRDQSDDGVYEDNTIDVGQSWATTMIMASGLEACTAGSVSWCPYGRPEPGDPSRNVFNRNVFRARKAPALNLQGNGFDNTFSNNVFWGNNVDPWPDKFISNHVNMAHGNTFDHNTFYQNDGFAALIHDAYDSGGTQNTFTNNIFSFSGTTNGYAYDHTSCASMETRYVGNHNLFYSNSGSVGFSSCATSLAQWQSQVPGRDASSIEANPLFTDPANGDFSLQTGSPALGMGADGSNVGANLTSVTAPPSTTPSFNIAPTTLDFFATQSGADPAQQGVAVFGVNGLLQWEVSTPVNWITFSATSGSTPTAVMVRVSNTLPVGTYSAKVNFIATNYAGVTGSVNVNFTVTATDVLSVSKTAYNFKAVQGHTAQDQYLTVQSGAAAGWTGTVNTGSAPAWLSITPTSGTVYNDPANPVHIQVNAADLGIASYTGTITVASTGAVPSSVVITVNLSVTPPPIMDTSPRPLNVSVTEGKTARSMLEISNRGASETELDWSITQPTEPWIKLSITGDCGGPFPSPISGFAAGGRTSVVTACITTVPAGSPQLVPGTYTTTLTVLAPGAELLGGAATDVVPVNLTVTTDTTPPTVVTGSIFFGHFDTTTTPVTQYAVLPSASCTTTPPTFNVEISWTSDEYGDTRLKWGEQLDADGHPLYERGTVLKPEGLDTGAHTGGTLYHTVSLSNMNYVYGGHTYYYAIASQDRYGNPVDWNATGVWTDHDQSNAALYLNFKIGSTCDESAPTNVNLQLPTGGTALFGTVTVVMSAQDESLITRFELLKKNETGPDTVLQNFSVPPASCTSTGNSYSCLITVLFDTKLITPDGTWFLVARAYDAVGLTGLSPEVAITVSNATPMVSAVTALPTDLGGGQWQTVITWDTDEPSDSSIQYGMEDDDGTFKGYTYVQSGDDTGSTTVTSGHRVTLSGLLAGRVYHYMITSCPTGVSDPERCGH